MNPENVSASLSDCPNCKAAQEALSRQESFAAVLDLMMLLHSRHKFLAAAMTFCNELASHHHCERVSLGWFLNGYVRLQAISHADDFDKKMEAVQKLESAMEEALDQNTEIILPSSKDSKAITRDHEAFVRLAGVPFFCSLPLRVEDHVVAVAAFERSTSAFTDNELRLLRLLCDQAAKRLAELKEQDQWLVTRLASSWRKTLAGWLGFEHTWAKVLVIFAAILLAVLCFVPVRYRIEAPVILRTDDVSYLTAPFDGHIEKVRVRVGDAVNRGDELLRLDRNDLLIEEARLTAEESRYSRESEKAQASSALADMRIADALKDQSSARLDMVHYRLNQVSIKSPFSGVIVEGDLMERAGSPVKQGDLLFKIGQVDRIFAELEVKESDVHNVYSSQQGELALAGKPEDVFQVQVFRIEPAAVPKKDGNVFAVHCNFSQEIRPWFRPGMTGVAKLNAGKRTLMWILTHRTIDFLRLHLWW